MIGKIYNQKINSDVSNLTNLALYFLLLSHNLFLYFLYSNSVWTGISFPTKYSKKMEPCKPLKPATVLRTVRFDCGSSGFMHFSHRAVLKGKNSKKWAVRGFSSDRTVRSGFQNLAHKCNELQLTSISYCLTTSTDDLLYMFSKNFFFFSLSNKIFTTLQDAIFLFFVRKWHSRKWCLTYV